MARRQTTEADLAQVDSYATADFTGAEKAVLRFTEAFYRDHRSVADDVWDELKRHYTEPAVLEIGLDGRDVHHVRQADLRLPGAIRRGPRAPS